MKKTLLLGALIFSSAPAFTQMNSNIPVIAVNITQTSFAHVVNNEYRSLVGLGLSIEFMVGGRLYFYGNISGDYLFSFTSAPNSIQFGFLMGLGYVILQNRDVKGFSLAFNIAPLGIGLDIRDIGTLTQSSVATYRFQLSLPLRFHYSNSRAFQLSPFLVMGFHTVGNAYNFLISGGISLGLTY